MLVDDFGVKILYEDNHLIFATKPFGVIVQEDQTKDMDMLTILKDYLKIKYNKPGNVFVGLVHRLDRPAGGVMVFAKTSKGASRICEQIRLKTTKKIYMAVLSGELKQKEGTLKNYLVKNNDKNFVKIADNNNGKYAELNYYTISVRKGMTLVKIELVTGRFHQIRVQFSGIGHPLYGDMKYGGPENVHYNGIALWAQSLTVSHPTTAKEISICEELPQIFPWNVF